MPVDLSTASPVELQQALAALREWQREGAPMQLHPGDLGWFWQHGAAATAAATRTWSRDGEALAVGLLDGPGLLRLTIAPEARQDAELATRIADDATDADAGVLPVGSAAIEAPMDALLQQALLNRGWSPDEPWTPLRRDLTAPVEDSGLRIEVIAAGREHVRASVHQAAFESRRFTVERWREMASGPAYEAARCLVGFDAQDEPVAMATVWSAGPGKPGLLEPVGVEPAFRGRGYGRAIAVAAAAALQRLGSSSALVATPSSNVAAVAAYASAGFDRRPEIRDLARPE